MILISPKKVYEAYQLEFKRNTKYKYIEDRVAKGSLALEDEDNQVEEEKSQIKRMELAAQFRKGRQKMK